MRLSDEALKGLARVIVGSLISSRLYDNEKTIERIMEFFFDIEGACEVHCPSTNMPVDYMAERLGKYNNTNKIKEFLENFLEPSVKNVNFFTIPYVKLDRKTNFAIDFRPHLEKDGFKLIAIKKEKKLAGETAFYYRILDEKEFAETPVMEENTPAKNIKEEAEKRFAEKNYPATIDSCFTLVETVIKDMLDEMDIKYKKSAQFITLYPLLADALNLNPAGENIESYLQKTLQGLRNQVDGLYHLANKAGSRHKPEHIPKRQDAKLAMNAAFTLCEYLFDTHKSRQA